MDWVEIPIWIKPGPVCKVSAFDRLLFTGSSLLLLALFSSALIYALRLNRLWLLILVGLGLATLSGCSSWGSVFSRKAEQNLVQSRQWTQGGLAALDNGKLDRAANCFNRALEFAPKDRRIRSHLAKTYAQRGEIEQAIAQMQRAIESTHDPYLILELGELYLANDQWLPAMRQAEVALSMDRKIPSAWALKGKIQAAKGDYSEAVVHFQRALGLDPSQHDVHLQMAETYQKMGRPMRSLATLEHLLAKFPSDQQPQPALVAKGKVLMEIEQVGEAIDVLARTCRRTDASPLAFEQLCRAQVMANQHSDARTTINRAVVLFPEQSQLQSLANQLDNSDRRFALNATDLSQK